MITNADKILITQADGRRHRWSMDIWPINFWWEFYVILMLFSHIGIKQHKTGNWHAVLLNQKNW